MASELRRAEHPSSCGRLADRNVFRNLKIGERIAECLVTFWIRQSKLRQNVFEEAKELFVLRGVGKRDDRLNRKLIGNLPLVEDRNARFLQRLDKLIPADGAPIILLGNLQNLMNGRLGLLAFAGIGKRHERPYCLDAIFRT